MKNEEKFLIVKNFAKPNIKGNQYKLQCMTGNRKGEVFYLIGNRITLGRGDSADLQFLDTKLSREHAELTRVSEDYILTDLDSQNGIFVNNDRVKQHRLDDGDKIIIGQVVFKFNKIEVKSDLKIVEKKDIEDEIEGRDIEQGKPKNPLFIVVAVILIIYFFLSDMEEKKEKDNSPRIENYGKEIKDVTNDFIEAARKKQYEESKELELKIAMIFEKGLREAREGNYFRAINEFNLALILSPDNARAKYYLEKTKNILNNDIEKNFIKGKRDVDGLKFKRAQAAYCDIMRLLQNYADDERYKAAEDNIFTIEEKLGLEKGEIKCF